MSFWTLLVLFGAFSYVVAGPVPCKISEADCIKKIFSNTYSKILDADPELGTESLDPMHHDEIEGNFSFMKFKMTDNTVTGYRDCRIGNVTIYPKNRTLNAELLCPKLTMNGKYNIHGQLMSFPVEGSGDFSIISNKYKFLVEIQLNFEPGSDGKTYVSVKSFKQSAEPLDRVKYDFKNLFNGQKDLADALLKFANDNWYAIAKEVQDPVINANLKKLMKNVNKYYKKQAIEDLVSM